MAASSRLPRKRSNSSFFSHPLRSVELLLEKGGAKTRVDTREAVGKKGKVSAAAKVIMTFQELNPIPPLTAAVQDCLLSVI